MIYLLITSIIWAFSFGIIKTNLVSLSPDFVAFTRMAFPLLLFLPFYRGKNLSSKDKLLFFSIGAIQYGLMYIFCIRAYAYLPAHLVVLFTAVTPLYVTLIHDLLRRSFNGVFLTAAFVALLSVFTLYGCKISHEISFTGFCLVQLSDICFALGMVLYKRAKTDLQKVQDKNLYALLFAGGALTTFLSTTLFEGWSSLYTLSSYQGILLAYLGLIPSGICFFLWNRATALVNTGTLAVSNNLKIPLGVFVSLVFFGETANIPYLAISSLLIIMTLTFTERYNKYFQKKVFSN